MTDAIETIITDNAALARKLQFCQQVKQIASMPANLERGKAQYEQSKKQMQAAVLTDTVKADLGKDYDAIKSAVDAL